MAILIDNRVFEPRDHSFIERGLQQYGKTYFQLAEMMDKIMEDNGKYKLPESWKEGNDIQNGFFAQFNPAAEDFAKGMTSQNVEALLNSRRYYREKMVPLHEAVDRFNTVQDMITRGGEDTIVGNASDLTIDQIYKNGALHSPLRTISRQSVVKGAQQYFKGIDNLLLQDPSFKAILDEASKGWVYSSQQGFDPRDILEAALSDYVNNSNSPESDTVRKYLDSYIAGLGTEGFDEQGKSRTRGAALEGMVDAFQSSRSKVVQDLRPRTDNYYSQMNRREHQNATDDARTAIQAQKAQDVRARQASSGTKTPRLRKGETIIDGQTVIGEYNVEGKLKVKDSTTGQLVPPEVAKKYEQVTGSPAQKPKPKGKGSSSPGGVPRRHPKGTGGKPGQGSGSVDDIKEMLD